jgi:ATP-dependent DNA helicase RecQ
MPSVLKPSLLYLISQPLFLGTFKEMIKSISSCISVSTKGEQFLSSARPDYQPPLFLPVTGEMVDDEEHTSTSSEVEEFKSLATLEFEGLSQVGKLIVVHFFILTDRATALLNRRPTTRCGKKLD